MKWTDRWRSRLRFPYLPRKLPWEFRLDLLRRRPDIRRAERALAAQTARIGAAVGELYPKFSILGSFGLDARQFSQLFQRDAISASIGPRMQWQIFSYGRLRCNILVQETRQDQLALQYQAAVLRGAEEVDNSLVSYVRERERVTYLSRTVEASRRAVELSGKRYVGGDVNFQRVLDSQRSLLQSEDLLALSQANVALHLISLYRALGGGWQLPPPPPVSPEVLPRPLPGPPAPTDLPMPNQVLVPQS